VLQSSGSSSPASSVDALASFAGGDSTYIVYLCQSVPELQPEPLLGTTDGPGGTF